MAETALDDLLALMGDKKVKMRDRLNAAISASRVSPLVLAGEEPPEAIGFLRWVIAFKAPDGSQFSASFRRESAAALSYYERRVQKMALTFDVADDTERRTKWRRILNGLIRHHLWKHGRWPQDKGVLFGPNDLFELPAGDPDRALNAILLPVANRAERRRRAVDDPGGVLPISSEEERQLVLEPVIAAMRQRLDQFGLAH